MYLFTSLWLGTIDFHLWHKHARIEKHRSSTVGRKEWKLSDDPYSYLAIGLSWWFRVRVGGRSLWRKRTTKPLFTLRHVHLHDYGWRDVSRETMMTILRCHQSGNNWINVHQYIFYSNTYLTVLSVFESWILFEDLFSRSNLFLIANRWLLTYNPRAETRIIRSN